MRPVQGSWKPNGRAHCGTHTDGAFLYTLLGPNDIWAIGGMWKDHTFDPVFVQGLIEHWDGQRWSLVSNPHPQGCTALLGIARDLSVPGKLWIVGSNGPQCRELDSLSNSALIETNR